MYFVDSAGNLQLTGGGLAVVLLVFIIFVVVVWETVKKIFFYRSAYIKLKKEYDELERYAYDGVFYVDLEKYYQKRKQWEKNNRYW